MDPTSDGMPGWRQNVVVLAVVSFVVTLGFVFALPILPLLMRELTGDTSSAATWAGIAFAAAPVCSILVLPLWGRLTDRFGHRPMLIRSHIAVAVAFTLMALVTRPEQIVLCRMIVGLIGGVNTSSLAAVAASAPRQHAARAISWIQIGQVSSTVAGPALGGVLADLFGLRLPFLVGAVLMASALVAILVFFKEPPRQPAQADRPVQAARKGTAAGFPLWLFWIGLFLAVFTDSAFGPMVPLYLAYLGAPPDRLGTITGVGFAIAGITAALATYFVPRRLAGREPQVLCLALALGLLLAVPAALAAHWWQIVPLRGLVGLVTGTVMSLAYSQAAREARPGQEGVGMSKMMSGNMLGWGVGSFTAGMVAGFDLRAPFYMATALLIPGIAVWSYYLVRNRLATCGPTARSQGETRVST